MPNTFVVGDIHGSYRALFQCFENSRIDLNNDTLICLGDVADGWPETKEAIDLLLKVKNLIYVMGNHDFWALEWMETGYADAIWLRQGGQATVNSYSNQVPDSHHHLLKTAKHFHRRNNELFVHAGIQTDRPIEEQGISTFLWDRRLTQIAKENHIENEKRKLTSFDNIFVGHTPLIAPAPQQFCEVWMMDTGAGWHGRLSMMNVDSGEMFVSDPVAQMYPGIEGRKKI